MSSNNRHLYQFGDFLFDKKSLLLSHKDKEIHLPPKALELLKTLIENRGKIVDRKFLLNEVWADSFIEDSNLTVTISQLRKTFSDHEKNSNFIETVPKRGYRFTSEVQEIFPKIESSINETKNSADVLIDRKELVKPSNEDVIIPNSSKTKRLVLISICAISFFLLLGFVGKNYLYVTNDKIESIAVLPFESVGNNVENKATEFGMADTLITRLSNLREVSVRPTSTIIKYIEKKVDTAQAGRELGVDAVLEGTIQEVGNKFRVTVRLIRIKDGSTIWATNFDEESKDIFGVQDEISLRIAKELELKLSDTEKKQLAKRQTENKEAYEAYITGRYLWNQRTPEAFQKSLESFQKAVELDPNYALAYTGIADCYQLFAEYHLIPISEGFAKSRSAARKALELDDSLAEAHASLGYTLAFYDWDFDAAEKEFKRSIELNPNYPTARQWYAEYLLAMQRFDESFEQLQKAKELAPNSLAINANFATYYMHTGNYDKVIEIGNELVKQEPKFPWGYIALDIGYYHTGEKAKYVDSHIKVEKHLYGNSDENIKELKKTYEEKGWEAFWRKRIEQMDEKSDSAKYNAWEYLNCYLVLNDEKQSIKWLEKVFEERSRWLLFIRSDPLAKNIRNNPKYKEIIGRIGFPQ